MNSNNIILIKKSTEEEATICWDGETCKPDEFGCCVVCCECKACICNLQKAEEEEECTDENKCGECTYCARTKVCEYCGCVGGCDSSCRGDIVFKCSRCDVAIIRNSEEHDNCQSNEEGDVWWCMHCKRKEDDEDDEEDEEEEKK